MPEDDRDKIFEPFFTGKTQGTGSGLAVARRVVELHGGTIAVDDAPAAAHCSASRFRRPDMARILVADDEAGLREFIADALELDEHDGRRGRRTARRPRSSSTSAASICVLTDLKMPGLDGMALLRKVRAEQPEVEVIVMTAHGTVDNAVEAMKLGAFEYLQKPISRPRRAAPARRARASSGAACAIASTAPSATPSRRARR